MEAKAVKFVKIIRRKLKSDPALQGLQLEKLFVRAIEKLPDGELKAELQGNLSRYLKLLTQKKRVLQETGQNGQLVSGGLSGNAAKRCNSVDRRRKIHSLEQKRPPGSINMGKQAKFSGPTELQWLADLRWNVTLTCAMNISNEVLQTTMKLYTSKVVERLTEDFLNGLKPDRLLIVEQELKRFLHYCDHCYVAREKFSQPPTYHGLMAALLSVYVDVVLLSTRQKDAEQQRHKAKRLMNSAAYLLRRSHGHILDVVLQQTQVTPSDSAVLLPLYRKALELVNVTSNPTLYTKYMLAARQATDLFTQESVALCETALQVAAPVGYSEWLRNQNVCLPEMECIGGVAVSSVLLQECDADSLGLLMDMLTDDVQMSDSSSLVTTETLDDTDHTAEMTRTGSEEPLFFIDKEATNLPIELQPKDIDLERVVTDDISVEPENQSDVEEVELAAHHNLDISGGTGPGSDTAERLSSSGKQLSGRTKRLSGGEKRLFGEQNRLSGREKQLSGGAKRHSESDDEVEFRTPNVAANQNIDISGEAEQDSDGAERLSSSTQQLSGKAKRLSGRAKHLGDSDNETPAVTPELKIRTDSTRRSSARKSQKKSVSKKTPQHDNTGDVVCFTGLRSHGKEQQSTPKLKEHFVSGELAPSGDEQQKRGAVNGGELDEGSVSSQVARRRSCRLRRRTMEVDQAQVEEAVTLHRKKKALKVDAEMATDDVDELFFIDKKASRLPAELQSLKEKTEDDGSTAEARKVTPKAHRKSDIKKVLSAVKSLKANGSSKKTPQDKSKDVVGSSHTRLKSRCEEPVSFSSPVLASGGKRARKSKDITTQDDLDDSWVVIDTPWRKSGDLPKSSVALERARDEEALDMKKTLMAPKSMKRELRKSTPQPVHTPISTSVFSPPTSTRKRKSLLGGETPKQDSGTSGVGSTYSLRQRRKSTLTPCSCDL
ncbi:hypothetical protein LSAT2_000826 [Lamellibrachia satsuma]|nr:hypothetical protein LSAT2_000826 [Lamellibrachia satsuma]